MDAIWGFLSGILVVAAIVGVIILVLVIFAIIYIVRRVMFAVRGEDYVPLFKFKKKQRPYVHQDVDAGATADSISDILRRYQQNEMFFHILYSVLCILYSVLCTLYSELLTPGSCDV